MLPDVAHCHNLLAHIYKNSAAAKLKDGTPGVELAKERSDKHRELANNMYAEMKMNMVVSYQ